MRCLTVVVATCLGAFAFTLPARAAAQSYVAFGAGAQFPTGEYADRLDPGWIVSGRIAFPVGSKGLSLGIEGFVGRNVDAQNSSMGEGLGGALFFAAFRFGDRTRTGAYLFGGLGGGGQGTGEVIVSWFPAYSLGAGVEAPTSKLGLFGEARYTANPDFSFFEVLGGLKIPLGKGR